MKLPLFIKQAITSVTVGFVMIAAPTVVAQELAPKQTVRLGLGVDDIRTLDPHFSTGVGETPDLPGNFLPLGTRDSGLGCC